MLHQQHSAKLRRARCSSARKAHIGVIERASRKAICSPDDEAHGLTATIAPRANSLGKSLTGGILTPAVQYDLDGIVRNGAIERDRLLGYAALRFAGATLPHLDDIGTAQAQRTSSLDGAIPITFGKLAIGAGLEAANRGDHNPHHTNSGVATL